MFDEPRSLRAVALIRIFVGPIVLWHLYPFLVEMFHGRYYADFFYSPWVSWLPHLPKPVYFALLGLCVVCALLLSAGKWTRAVSVYTFAFVAYNLFVNQLHYRQNRAFMVIVLAFLALLPAGKLLSLDARKRGWPDDALARLWPLYLLRFEVVSIYIASGFSKLINPDWVGGIVTYDRILKYRHQVEEAGVPQWLIDILVHPDFHWWFGKVAVFTELVIAAGLLIRKTRYATIWLAISFHTLIGISLRVEVFSYLAIVGLMIWATPSTRDRTVRIGSDASKVAQFCLRHLDWLARFRALPATGSDELTLIDRDGREFHGREATIRVMARCPVLFFFVAPLTLPGVRRLWRRRGAKKASS